MDVHVILIDLKAILSEVKFYGIWSMYPFVLSSSSKLLSNCWNTEYITEYIKMEFIFRFVQNFFYNSSLISDCCDLFVFLYPEPNFDLLFVYF